MQPLKACWNIAVIPSGMTSDLRVVQSLKALDTSRPLAGTLMVSAPLASWPPCMLCVHGAALSWRLSVGGGPVDA